MSDKLKPWLILAVIFAAGALSGAALTMALSPRFLHRPPGMAQMKKHIEMRYALELNLTPDQQAKIQPILDDAAKDLQAVHHDEIQRVSQIFKATDDKIAPLLTEQQKAELPKLEEERENAFHGHMRPWDGPGDGPFPGPPGDRMPPPHFENSSPPPATVPPATEGNPPPASPPQR